MTYTRDDVQMHSEMGRDAHPAVNIKLLMSYNDLNSRLGALLPLELGGVSDDGGQTVQQVTTDERFTLEWIEANLTEAERQVWWESACEDNFNQGVALAEETWPRADVWSEGRSSGWMVVGSIGDPEDWDREQVALWAEFEQRIRAIVDDVPRTYLWLINANVFEPWAEELDKPEAPATEART